MGIYEEECEVNYLSNGQKEVAFIGLHHIGIEEFYMNVSRKVDSLQKSGYVVFYESLAEDDSLGTLIKEENLRKIRKLSGVIPDNYLDTASRKLYGKYRYSKKIKLVKQPDEVDMSVDMSNAIRVDITLNELVSEFEKKYGEIELDECDLQTSTSEQLYICDKVEKDRQEAFYREYLIGLRDRYLARQIHDSRYTKIAVLYGKFHLSGTVVELRKLDSYWDYK
jgi:hypothetical protein